MTLVPIADLPSKGLTYSARWVDHLISENLLPRPIVLSPRKRAFLESELDRVISARVSGKPDDEIRQLVREMTASRNGGIAA